MIRYVLPSTGILGGVKVGYQFAELLGEVGACVTVASPGGRAAQWFASSVPVVDREETLARLGPRDEAIFSLPHDYEALAETGARLVFHCQGTDPRIDPILRDPAVTILTGWEQATRYVREGFGREPIEVGIAVSDVFFAHFPSLRREDRVAFMPRRGRGVARKCRRRTPALEHVAIDDRSEDEVARALAGASIFLATARQEWFGLPALEAMAAGCVVVSVPVVGGVEYLEPGENCVMAEAANLPDALERIAAPGAASERARLRTSARATAARYRRAMQRERLRRIGPIVGGRAA